MSVVCFSYRFLGRLRTVCGHVRLNEFALDLRSIFLPCFALFFSTQFSRSFVWADSDQLFAEIVVGHFVSLVLDWVFSLDTVSSVCFHLSVNFVQTQCKFSHSLIVKSSFFTFKFEGHLGHNNFNQKAGAFWAIFAFFVCHSYHNSQKAHKMQQMFILSLSVRKFSVSLSVRGFQTCSKNFILSRTSVCTTAWLVPIYTFLAFTNCQFAYLCLQVTAVN